MLNITNSCGVQATGIVIRSLTLLTLAVDLDAQNPPHSRVIDDFVRAQMAERRIPGMQIAVLQDGKLVKLGAYGYANVEFDVKVQPSTLFSVASVSKSLTSVGVMMLVEDGKVNLDDSIGHYLDNLPVSWRTVDIRRLLNYTSGLPDVAADQYTTKMIAETSDSAIRLLRERPMDFVPRSDSRYNQTNYMLLGMLIEKISGRSFVQFCTERLFRPFGVTNAVFGDSRVALKNRSTVYTPFRLGTGRPVTLDHLEVLNYEFPEMSYAGNGLNIPIADFAAWPLALTNGRIIKQSSLDQTWNAATLNDGSVPERPDSPAIWKSYGLGWVLKPDSSRPMAGGTGGLRAAFFVYPKDKLAVIVLTNLQGSRPEALVHEIALQYLR